MLTELRISNFRIFDDEVSVRFRPITVLIGRNSSGKSSIIKFLLMLQQSITPGRSQFLTAEGDRVNLGAFSALKNSLTAKRNLTFDLAFRSLLDQPEDLLVGYLESFGDVDYGKLLYQAHARVSYGRRNRKGSTSYSLVDDVTDKHYMMLESKILEDSRFGDFKSLREINEPYQETADNEEKQKRYVEWLEKRTESIVRAAAAFGLISTLHNEIDSTHHLSPVRDETQRVIIASPPPMDSVGQRGQYTLPHLQEMMVEFPERYEFIKPHLESVAGIDDIRFSRSSGYVSRALAKNKTTGAEVLIADYGFGVSQCLPIFVQGALMPRYTSLMVEQPEAQLHPTAQLEMGSYFADLWNQRKVGAIIETHSDNILLRLRRLIAKEELSHQDVSVAFFTFDDNKNNMPVIRNLDINQDGSMEPGLPMEFFGANIIEGMKLGAGV